MKDKMVKKEGGWNEVGFVCCLLFFFFFKQKTAYEILTCDWSSDVCSSDLISFEEWVAIGISHPQ